MWMKRYADTSRWHSSWLRLCSMYVTALVYLRSMSAELGWHTDGSMKIHLSCHCCSCTNQRKTAHSQAKLTMPITERNVEKHTQALPVIPQTWPAGFTSELTTVKMQASLHPSDVQEWGHTESLSSLTSGRGRRVEVHRILPPRFPPPRHASAYSG